MPPDLPDAPLLDRDGTVIDAASFARATGATPGMMEDLERYRTLLELWNERINLVGPSALAQFWPRHAYDSAQLLALAPEAQVWADIGAGAGFPGVILAILLRERPGAVVHLIDSVAKRTRFLHEVVQALDLPAIVHTSRAEDLPAPLDVDIVTARACARMPTLLGYAWPCMNAGARGLFLKGRDVEQELTEAHQMWRFDASLHPSLSDPSGRIVQIERLVRV